MAYRRIQGRGGGAHIYLNIFRKTSRYTCRHVYFYSGFSSGEKTRGGGGVQFEILKNPGIDLYSGFRENLSSPPEKYPRNRTPGTFFFLNLVGKKTRGSRGVGKQYTSSYDHDMWPVKILERSGLAVKSYHPETLAAEEEKKKKKKNSDKTIRHSRREAGNA